MNSESPCTLIMGSSGSAVIGSLADDLGGSTMTLFPSLHAPQHFLCVFGPGVFRPMPRRFAWP